MATTKLRKRDTGQAGNRGEFAQLSRREAAIDVSSATPPVVGRAITLPDDVDGLAEGIESSYDEDGRTVVAVQLDREKLPTSSFTVGSAP